jgi:hypothetical protein
LGMGGSAEMRWHWYWSAFVKREEEFKEKN